MDEDEKEILRRVITALEAAQSGFKAQSDAMKLLDKRLRSLEEKVILGNGEKSIITRVALLEQAKKSGTSKITMLVTVMGYVLALVGTVLAAVLSNS